MPIYTRGGDRGETALPGNRRLPKTATIFECLGDLDQANGLVGLSVSLIDREKETELVHLLEHLQSDLLSIGSVIAAKRHDTSVVLTKIVNRTIELEGQIDTWDAKLPGLKNFILPGGCVPAAVLQLARVSIRQAERSFHRLSDTTGLEPIAVMLNRLSDYFFQAARYLNMRSNKPDIVWKISNTSATDDNSAVLSINPRV